MTLLSITNALKKLKDTGEPPKTGPVGSARFTGDTGPFGKGASGTPPPPMPPSDGGSAGAQASTSIQDSIMLRFVDVNIIPGYTFEYRIQMKVANPNLGKDKLVGRPDDAKVEELTGPYTEILFSKDGRKTTGIAVPPESFVYAYSHPGPNLKPDHTRLQVQAWTERVRTDKTNPLAVDEVGDWLVEDLDIARGQYVAGVKNVKLPVWDPRHNRYQFKDMKAGRPGTSGATATGKGAVPIEFGAGTLLVDFEGGKSTQAIKGKTVVDDPGMEMLLVTSDGRLVVRNSAADKHETHRVTREKEWLAWQEETKKGGEAAKPAGSGDGFDKGKGGKQ